jgi:hypothetical protein
VSSRSEQAIGEASTPVSGGQILPANDETADLSLQCATRRPNYDQIVGERDPFCGRLPDLARFSDVLTLVRQPEHEGTTHPEADPDGYARIDHIFVSGDPVECVSRAWINTKADGSDHQPVFAELSFPQDGTIRPE